eukprot:580514-Pyramimonas_sp.AAC.1
MQSLPLGPSVGATKRVKGVPNRARVRHADPAGGHFGEAPCGATERVRRVLRRVRVCQAGPAAGAFG